VGARAGPSWRAEDGRRADRARYELREAGRAVRLERIPMEILLFMLERPEEPGSFEGTVECCLDEKSRAPDRGPARVALVGLPISFR